MAEDDCWEVFPSSSLSSLIRRSVIRLRSTGALGWVRNVCEWACRYPTSRGGILPTLVYARWGFGGCRMKNKGRKERCTRGFEGVKNSRGTGITRHSPTRRPTLAGELFFRGWGRYFMTLLLPQPWKQRLSHGVQPTPNPGIPSTWSSYTICALSLFAYLVYQFRYIPTRPTLSFWGLNFFPSSGSPSYSHFRKFLSLNFGPMHACTSAWIPTTSQGLVMC